MCVSGESGEGVADGTSDRTSHVHVGLRTAVSYLLRPEGIFECTEAAHAQTFLPLSPHPPFVSSKHTYRMHANCHAVVSQYSPVNHDGVQINDDEMMPPPKRLALNPHIRLDGDSEKEDKRNST